MSISMAKSPAVGQLPNRASLVRTILRLKLKLYFRGHTGISQLFFVLGAALVAALTIGFVGAIIFFRNHDSAADALAVGGSVLGLGWILMPILGGGERFLNPRPFSLLPIPLGNLLVAFLVASTVGIFATASAVIVLASVSQASTVLQFILMVASSATMWITMVLFGRLSVAISNTLQSRRRGRDAATVISAIAGISLAVLSQSFVAVAELVTAERLTAARGVTRWLPWGWAAETSALLSDGQLLRALLWFVPSILLPVGLFILWRRLFASLLSVKAEQVKPTVSSSLVLKPLRGLQDTTLAASFSRGVLQLRRDPREKLQLASMLPLLFVAAFPVRDLVQSGDDRLVLTTIAWGASTGFIAANLFGADGPNVGVELLTTRNSKSILIGKALVRVAIVFPMVVVFSIGLAVLTGGWGYLPASIFMATSLSVCSVGFGMNLSVRHPYPLPDNLGFTSNNMSNGLLPGLLLFVVIGAALVVTAPFVVSSILVSLFWSQLAGAVLAFAGLVWSVAVFCGRRRKRRHGLTLTIQSSLLRFLALQVKGRLVNAVI